MCDVNLAFREGKLESSRVESSRVERMRQGTAWQAPTGAALQLSAARILRLPPMALLFCPTCGNMLELEEGGRQSEFFMSCARQASGRQLQQQQQQQQGWHSPGAHWQRPKLAARSFTPAARSLCADLPLHVLPGPAGKRSRAGRSAASKTTPRPPPAACWPPLAGASVQGCLALPIVPLRCLPFPPDLHPRPSQSKDEED